MTKKSRGMTFMTKELADWRVSELKAYGRKAERKGRTVYELFD